MATGCGCLLVLLAIPLVLLVVGMGLAYPLPTLVALVIMAWPTWWAYQRIFRPLMQWRLSPVGHRFAGTSVAETCNVCQRPRAEHRRD